MCFFLAPLGVALGATAGTAAATATGAAVTSLALTAASTAMSFVQQSQQASAQKGYQDQMVKMEQQKFQADALAVRQTQAIQNESTAIENYKVQREAQKAQATIRTGSGEAGISGISVDNLIHDYAAQEAAIYQQSRRQQEINNMQTSQQLVAMATGAQYNAARIREPISRPSPLAAALNIGAAGLGAYNQYRSQIPSGSTGQAGWLSGSSSRSTEKVYGSLF